MPSYSTALSRTIAAPPSISDKPGGLYVYATGPNHWKRPLRLCTNGLEGKIGRAGEPPKSKKQWERQCLGQPQKWLSFYWEVPYATKFGEFCVYRLSSINYFVERIIHLHYKRMGAWKRPVRCRWCGVKHIEKFDLKICGGFAGIISTVEYYLGILQWPIVR